MGQSIGSFSDFVTWMFPTENNVIINSNGTVQKTYVFTGRDGSHMTEEEKERYYVGLNNVFRRLKSGFILYVETQKYRAEPAATSKFSDPLLQELEGERQKTLNRNFLYKNTYYLTICYLPPSEALQKVSKLLDTDNKELLAKVKNSFRDFFTTLRSSDRDMERWEQAAHTTYENIKVMEEKFLTECDVIAKGLRSYFTDIRPADRQETLTYLHSCVSDRHFPVKDDPHFFIGERLTDATFLGGREPKLGDQYMAVIGIKELPSFVTDFMFDRLNALSSEFRFVIRYMALSKEDAVAEVNSIIKKHADSKKNLWTLIREAKEHMTTDQVDNVEAAQDEADAREALNYLSADDFGLGYLTLNIVLLNGDKAQLDQDASEIRSMVNELGFIATIEKDNAAAAWMSTIPSCYKQNVRNYLMNSTDFACVSPFGAYWQGEKKNKHFNADCLIRCVTPEHLPFYFNLHCGDVGHTLIVGATGTGKSVLLNTISANFRKYPNCRVFVFDKSASSRVLTQAVGGNYYNLLVDSRSIAFQPLAHIDSDVERNWCLEWLVNYLSAQNLAITPTDRNMLYEALNSVAAAPQEERTLTALITMIQSEQIRNSLRDLSLKGAYGVLFDSSVDKFGTGRWQVFEMEKVMDNQQIVGPVLDYLFHRIEGQLDGSPTLMMLDECWLFFRNAAFRKKLVEYLKDFRKKNCSVVIATQNLSDIDGDLIPVIKVNMPTKIYLANPLALAPDIAAIYKGFGLNDREIEIVAGLKPKKEYYYKNEHGGRIFDLALSPLELAFLAATSTADQRKVAELASLSPEAFSEAWKSFKRVS